MGRGRPRKPKHLKVFEGNPDRRDISYEEPQADGLPKRPSDLGPFGRRHWDLIWPQALKWGAGKVDTASLRALCQWWEVQQQALKKGDVNAAQKAFNCWIRLAAKFGLSPADRAQMRTHPTEKRDELEQFIASR